MRATAKQLRRRARQFGEDIAQMISTAVAIGESDDWQGERYEAIELDIERYKARRDALLADAVALETKTAA